MVLFMFERNRVGHTEALFCRQTSNWAKMQIPNIDQRSVQNVGNAYRM